MPVDARRRAPREWVFSLPPFLCEVETMGESREEGFLFFDEEPRERLDRRLKLVAHRSLYSAASTYFGRDRDNIVKKQGGLLF